MKRDARDLLTIVAFGWTFGVLMAFACDFANFWSRAVFATLAGMTLGFLAVGLRRRE